MKIIAIGDIHGSPEWKKIVSNDADLYVFLGDYVDSFYYSNVEIMNNLLDVIEFKSANVNKVQLLVGNHDYQYMFGSLLDMSFTCSGFRPEAYWDLYDLFKKYESFFNVACEVDKLLFSHAGVTAQWWKLRGDQIKGVYHKYHGDEPNVSISEYLNFLILVKEREWLYDIGYKRGGLRGDYGSPLWADQQESRFGALPNYNHVVGHTPVSGIREYKINNETTITYCDCLGKTANYYFTEK